MPCLRNVSEEGDNNMVEGKARGLKLQGFSTKGLAGDLSAAVTKALSNNNLLK
jgi:hypothetical protein